MMVFRKILIFSLLLFISIIANATVAATPKPQALSTCGTYVGTQHRTAEFVVPNEPNPFDAKQIIAAAPAGVYAVVGGERALFDYLLTSADKVRELLAIDSDPSIIHFHKLNSILVRLAADGDIKTYQEVRLAAKTELWVQLAEQALVRNRISTVEFYTITNQANLLWWQKIMANEKWRQFNTKPLTPGDPFFAVNYLYDPHLLARVQRLALLGRYKTLFVDLGDPQQVTQLTQVIAGSGHRLALFDLSNAWENEFPRNYLGRLKTAYLLKTLNDVSENGSIALITFGRTPHAPMWYRGYTFGAFRAYTQTVDSWINRPHTWEDGAYLFERDLLVVQRQVSQGGSAPRSVLTTAISN